MQEFLLKVAATVNNYLSNYILLILLIGVGIFYSIKTKFVQVRCFGEGCKNVFGNIKLKCGNKKGGLSYEKIGCLCAPFGRYFVGLL